MIKNTDFIELATKQTATARATNLGKRQVLISEIVILHHLKCSLFNKNYEKCQEIRKLALLAQSDKHPAFYLVRT